MEVSPLPILSWILTHIFKKKVTVTVFNRSHYTTNLYEGHIDIRFDTLLPTELKLVYRVLCLVRKTLCQGKFVVGCLFGHGNAKKKRGGGVTDDKPPFEWTSHILPEDVSEDSLRCTEVLDDVSIARVYTLKYSIAMLKEICRSDYTCKYSTQLEQLREDIETLWGENTQQTDKICGSLQGMGLYKTDLFPMGQDIFISARVVREFKEKCTALAIPIYFCIP